ncbi:unnamed protein product, partial [Tilletia controversa]
MAKRKQKKAQASGLHPASKKKGGPKDKSFAYSAISRVARATVNGQKGVAVGQFIWYPSYEPLWQCDNENEMAKAHTKLTRAEAAASKAGHAGPSVRNSIFHSRGPGKRIDRDARIKWAKSSPYRIGPQPALIRKGLETYHFIFDESLTDRIDQLLLLCGQPPSFPHREPIPGDPIIKWCKSIEELCDNPPKVDDDGIEAEDVCGPQLGHDMLGAAGWQDALKVDEPAEDHHVLLRVIAGLMHLCVLSYEQKKRLYPDHEDPTYSLSLSCLLHTVNRFHELYNDATNLGLQNGNCNEEEHAEALAARNQALKTHKKNQKQRIVERAGGDKGDDDDDEDDDDDDDDE